MKARDWKDAVLAFNKALADQPMRQGEKKPQKKHILSDRDGQLDKALGHKYTKKVPTGNPQHPWRYVYSDDKSLVSGFRDSVGDQDSFDMYFDVASGTSPEKWHNYVSKFGYSKQDAEGLRAAIVKQEKEQHREHAQKQWDAEKALAFDKIDFAVFVVADVVPAKPSISVEEGLKGAGELFGGLEKTYPIVGKIIAAGLIRGLVTHTTRKKSGHEANYNPLTRNVEVNMPGLTAGTLLHEIGHALEELAPDGWQSSEGWGHGQPSASHYAASGDPSEQFAEAFVQLVAGDAIRFHQHAQNQARGVTEAMNALKDKK